MKNDTPYPWAPMPVADPYRFGPVWPNRSEFVKKKNLKKMTQILDAG